MFSGCHELTTICCMKNWSTSNATSENMFFGCEKLVGGKGTPWDSSVIDKTYARPDGGTASPGYFTAETMTSVKAMDNGQWTMDNEGAAIYNLAGQRLNKMQKGINIVGGRKIIRD